VHFEIGESESPRFLVEPNTRLIKGFSFPFWHLRKLSSSVEVMLLILITHFDGRRPKQGPTTRSMTKQIEEL